MLSEIKRVQNGEIFERFYVFECDRCGMSLPECDPRHDEEDKNYCPDCAYILGHITEQECKDGAYFSFGFDLHLDIIDGRVIAKCGKRRTKQQRDRRQSKEYADWRLSVFKRDNFTCQHCGASSVEFNAHHKLSYKKHPDKRLDLFNGITLCIPCHKEEHKRGIK